MYKFNSVVNTEYFIDFVEEQLELTERVIDKIPVDKEVTNEIINNIIRDDEELKEEFQRSLELTTEKVKRTETKNVPFNMVRKSCDNLESLDVQILKKLDEIELRKVKNQLENLELCIAEIKKYISENI